MILNNAERLNMLGILPKESSIATLRIVRELRENLGFSDDEIKQIGLVETPNENDPTVFDFTWTDDKLKDVPVSDTAKKVILDTFKKLDRKEQMTEVLLDLYSRFEE